MNRQGNKKNPCGGIEWTHYFGPRSGYTANPVRGCRHGCRWVMPNGDIAICYAEAIATNLATKAYPGGFAHVTWHPDELAEIRSHTEPCGIFIDSMSDLFGQDVQPEWLDEVIQTIRACPQHVFFSLTKNPSRFRQFQGISNPWPSNWLVGISYPPTFMFGKRWTLAQQRVWFEKALLNLCASPAQSRWVSVEPLSLDLSDILDSYRTELCFAVIGAASNGPKYYQPDRDIFRRTLHAFNGMNVFFKGNLDRNLAVEVAGKWREEFPRLMNDTIDYHRAAQAHDFPQCSNPLTTPFATAPMAKFCR
jgi:protein gp37